MLLISTNRVSQRSKVTNAEEKKHPEWDYRHICWNREGQTNSSELAELSQQDSNEVGDRFCVRFYHSLQMPIWAIQE